MAFEVFHRTDQTRRWRTPVEGTPTEFRLYGGGALCLSRPAAQAAGLTGGERVLLLFDEQAGTAALLRTASYDGWKLTPGASGVLYCSIGRRLLRMGVKPGAYPLEVMPYEGQPVPGFRFPVAPSVQDTEVAATG